MSSLAVANKIRSKCRDSGKNKEGVPEIFVSFVLQSFQLRRLEVGPEWGSGVWEDRRRPIRVEGKEGEWGGGPRQWDRVP